MRLPNAALAQVPRALLKADLVNENWAPVEGEREIGRRGDEGIRAKGHDTQRVQILTHICKLLRSC